MQTSPAPRGVELGRLKGNARTTDLEKEGERGEKKK